MKHSFPALAKFAICMAAIPALFLAACGGGGSSSSTSATGFAQKFTTSSAAGDVVQFDIDTTNKIYSYKVIQSSYGLTGKTSTGAIVSQNAEGSSNLSPSADNFIQNGSTLFPIKDGLIGGNVKVNLGSGAQQVPVFGVSNAITTTAALAGTYNFVGSTCPTPSAGVATAAGCASSHGTAKIVGTTMTICVGANIAANQACTATLAGTVSASATLGVYDFTRTGAAGSTATFVAYTAANGQNVAMLEFHDSGFALYGQAIASTQQSLTSGGSDGNYFMRNNLGGGALVSITGTTFVDHANFWPTNSTTPVTGTITYNSPWTGLVSFSRTDGNTGIAIQDGTGAFAARLTASPNFGSISTYFFETGIRY